MFNTFLRVFWPILAFGPFPTLSFVFSRTAQLLLYLSLWPAQQSPPSPPRSSKAQLVFLASPGPGRTVHPKLCGPPLVLCEPAEPAPPGHPQSGTGTWPNSCRGPAAPRLALLFPVAAKEATTAMAMAATWPGS